MLTSLFPRTMSFFDFFDQHAARTVEGSVEFQSLVASGANIPNKVKRIKEIEHETDVITHQCVEALHKTFVTPIDRDQIHRLISRMDDVMDFIDAAADRIALYELVEMTPEVRDLADILLRAAQEVVVAVRGLRNFKATESTLKACVNINRFENDGDATLRRALARLFKEERDPVKIIKWQEVYGYLEEATDRCEDVANIVEGIILENA